MLLLFSMPGNGRHMTSKQERDRHGRDSALHAAVLMPSWPIWTFYFRSPYKGGSRRGGRSTQNLLDRDGQTRERQFGHHRRHRTALPLWSAVYRARGSARA